MNPRLALFALMALAQIAVPLWMIVGAERTLAQGRAVKLRCELQNPVDPFRGAYVHLSFDHRVPLAGDAHLERGNSVYVTLVPDAEAPGFHRFGEVYASKPAGDLWFACTLRWLENDHAVLDLPFDRFYVAETGTAAQGVRFEAGRPPQAHVVLRVLRGQALIEDLVIDNMSLSR